MSIQDWYTATRNALLDLWEAFIPFLLKLIGALVIFIIGWFVAVAVGKLVTEVLKRLRFNQLFERGGWKQALERAEVKVDPAGFVGAIFKWVLVIVFLLAAVDVLGLTAFAGLLRDVINFLPNVVVAALIFVVAVIISDIVEKVLRTAVESTQVGYGQVVTVIVKWSIWIFAILAILMQLRIAEDLLRIIVTGFVALIALAGGIAFGLGGKDTAAEIWQSMKRKMQK